MDRWTEKYSPLTHVHIVRYVCLDPTTNTTKGDQRVQGQSVYQENSIVNTEIRDNNSCLTVKGYLYIQEINMRTIIQQKQ